MVSNKCRYIPVIYGSFISNTQLAGSRPKWYLYVLPYLFLCFINALLEATIDFISCLSSRINHGKDAYLFSFLTCTCACVLGPCLIPLRCALRSLISWNNRAMECNKEEATRAMEMAEKKMEKNDFDGARRIAKKAQSIYPELENISQLITVCDVHCSSLKRVLGSEKDWYKILQVEKLADESTVKKQYWRLALFLHPDKNRFPGTEAAFKLICEANAVLSEPTKKVLYDSKIRSSSRFAPVYPPTHHINKMFSLTHRELRTVFLTVSSV